MSRFSTEIKIDASKNHVWAILADFGGIYKFSPGVSNSYVTSAAGEGVGATRHCDLVPMGEVEERILEWRDGESYSLEIYEGRKTPPFKHAVASIGVREDGKGSAVTVNFDYALKYGPIGKLMEVAVVNRQFHSAFGSLLAGLKNYAETGEAFEAPVAQPSTV